MQLVEVDTLLALLLARAGLFSSVLGILSDGSGRVGENVARKEDKVGNDGSERGVGDEEGSDRAEGCNGTLSVAGELALGRDGCGGGRDVNVDIGRGGVVLCVRGGL